MGRSPDQGQEQSSTEAEGRAAFFAGWCRRCGDSYVAASPADANGACSKRCTRALRQLDPNASRGRARRRQHQRAALSAKRREWIAANVGKPCPVCGKNVHTEESAARYIAWADESGFGRFEAYPCPAKRGVHVLDLEKRRRKLNRKLRERRQRREAEGQ